MYCEYTGILRVYNTRLKYVSEYTRSVNGAARDTYFRRIRVK